MINEAKYRSPKFLRNFIDFEINTGEDIKGEKSKKQIFRDEKAAKQLKFAHWDAKWDEVDEELFKTFYSITFKGRDHNNVWVNSISSSELRDIKKKWRGDWKIWDKYDTWLDGEKKTAREKEEKERLDREEQRRITADLDKLYQDIVDDWRSARYYDKLKTPEMNGVVSVLYYFENGNVLKFVDNRLNIGDITYTLSQEKRNKFVQLFNAITQNKKKDGTHRPSGKKRSSATGSSNTSAKKWASHPKGGLYQTILDTIKNRKEQLRDMSMNDPDREGLQNELKAAKRRAETMKKKYKFEHVINNFDVWIK